MKHRVKIPKGPIALYVYRSEIAAYQKQAEQTKHALEEVIIEFQMLGLGIPSQSEINRMLVEGAENLVLEKLAGTEPLVRTEPVVIGGITINTEKFREMLDIPNLWRLEAFLFKAKNYNKDVIIFQEGEILLNEEALQAYSNSMTIWTKTESEKEEFLRAEEIRENIEYLQKKYIVTLIPRDNSYALKQYPPSYGDTAGTSTLDVHMPKGSLKHRGLSLIA